MIRPQEASDYECPAPDILEPSDDFSNHWQYNVIAICRPDKEAPGKVISAFANLHEVFNYYNGYYLRPPASSNACLSTYRIQLCMNEYCHTTEPHHVAYCVHIDCWKFVRRIGPRENLNASIYALAMSTADLFDIPGGGEDRNEDVSTFTDIEIDHNRQSPVGTLLALLSRFPKDIQLAISDASKGSPLSALTSVCRRKAGLLQSASVTSLAWTISSSHIHLNNPNNVAVKPEWTNIYGHMYVSDLQVVTRGVETRPVDCLQIRPIRGLRFALGVYGVRGIRLLYEDGSESPWLGSLSGCWIGSIYGTEIQMLHVLKDDLKCLRIDIMQDYQTPCSAPENPMMWDHEVLDDDFQHTYVHKGEAYATINHYPSWRLGKLHPLFRDGSYVNGITLYCPHIHSISGIVTHGGTNPLTGRKSDSRYADAVRERVQAGHLPDQHERLRRDSDNDDRCAIHLPLRNGERIQNVGFHGSGGTVSHSRHSTTDPVVMVCEMHPYHKLASLESKLTILDRYESRPDIKWRNPNPPCVPITAMFHDPLTVNGSGLFNSLGCRTGNAASLLEESSVPTAPLIPLGFDSYDLDPSHLFLSIANFQSVHRIAARQVNNRCIGLWVEHDNGYVDILGQWDPSFPLQITPLYNSEQGRMTGICFYSKQYHILRDEDEDDNIYYARVPDASTCFVNEIRIQVNGQTSHPSDDRGVFNHTNLSQPLAWWFTTRYDIVDVWKGTVQEVQIPEPKIDDLSQVIA